MKTYRNSWKCKQSAENVNKQLRKVELGSWTEHWGLPQCASWKGKYGPKNKINVASYRKSLRKFFPQTCSIMVEENKPNFENWI